MVLGYGNRRSSVARRPQNRTGLLPLRAASRKGFNRPRDSRFDLLLQETHELSLAEVKALREIGASRAAAYAVRTFGAAIANALLISPLRVAGLRLLGARIGSNTNAQSLSFTSLHRAGFSGLSVGANCWLGEECLLDLYERIEISEHVTLAPRVVILTHLNVGYQDHPLQKYFPHKVASVILERGVFIGANTTILPGVRIGEESFVAAGSVVANDVPPRTLVGGSPAKIIRAIR